MSRQRLARIERLVRIHEQHLDVARMKLMCAQQQVHTARGSHERAEALFNQAAATLRARAAVTVGALAEVSDHLATLRRHADAALAARREAASQAARRRHEVVDAERELKKVERWAESVGEALRERRTKQERRESDELAAQSHNRRSRHDVASQ